MTLCIWREFSTFHLEPHVRNFVSWLLFFSRISRVVLKRTLSDWPGQPILSLVLANACSSPGLETSVAGNTHFH